MIGAKRQANGRWRAKGRVKDKRGVLVPVTRTADDPDEARDLVRDEMALIAQRTETAGMTSRSKVRDLLDAYLTKVRDTHTETSYDRYRQSIEHVIKPELGDLALSEVTRARLRVFFADLNRQGRAAAGIRSIRSPLSQAFELAVEDELLTVNPVKGVRTPKVQAAYSTESLSVEQVQELLAAAAQDSRIGELELHDFLVLMLGTGCRISEILGLCWDKVDLDRRVMHFDRNAVWVNSRGVVLQEGKTRAARRTIPMVPMVEDVLRRRQPHRLRADGPVFGVGLHQKLRDPHGMRLMLRRFYAKVPFMRTVKQPTHVFRRTAATIMYRAGVSVVEISNMLGHSSPKMTYDVYLAREQPSTQAAAALNFSTPTRQISAQREDRV